MLKALELVGFKSFADRTRFDFPDGITVVVGPNGSGKSNVVDAVKWVLGAQSAKALRGADMADVIFKGSAEGGRKPANSAEVVLILDNTTRIFSNDADEVQVSRRVFQSGEGEYAINGQPCRLKDIKDLFRGTGVGVDAYSLIEQGKVDRLLQASAKDRRGIFEEAAGISRFKAKKGEAERRLARVDQNMLRLNDIVDEIGKRLSTLKGQAAKANRYREMTVALQIKRQQLGWLDRVALQRHRADTTRSLAAAQNAEAELQQKLIGCDETVKIEQAKWQQLQSAQDAIQAEYLEAQRNRIEAESGSKSSLERQAELIAEKAVLQDRIQLLQQRASLSIDEIQLKQSELVAIEQDRDKSIERLGQYDADLLLIQQTRSEITTNVESLKIQQSSIRESIAKYGSEIGAYQLHIQQIEHALQQHQIILAETVQEMSQLESDIASADATHQAASLAAKSASLNKQQAEDRLQVQRLTLQTAQEHLIAIQGKLHGVRERLNVLTQLEEQYTGAGRGGQQMLRLARDNRSTNHPSPLGSGAIVSNVWETVQGVVADLLVTEMHLAPLIDVALGSHSDAIVLSNGQIIDWINDGNYAIDGRVTLLRMDRLTSRRSGEKIQLDGLRGVLGRADRMTRFDEAYEPLVRFLLGTTWFVDTLTTALELSHFRGAGLRFVTAECQLVESDGSITLGSLHSGLALISRRSEMQSAREEIKQLEESVSMHVVVVANAQVALAELESAVRLKDIHAYESAKQLTASELRLEAVNLRKGKLSGSLRLHEENFATAQLRLAEAHDRILNAEQSIEELTIRQQLTDQQWADAERQFHHCEKSLHSQQALATEGRIQLARVEQRLVGMRVTVEQMEQDSEERQKNVIQAGANLQSVAIKVAAIVQSIADFEGRSEVARQAIQSIERKRNEMVAIHQQQNESLQTATRENDSVRRYIEKASDRIETTDKQLGQLEHEWKTLHDHYLQEFQLDLEAVAELAAPFLEEVDDELRLDESQLDLLKTVTDLRWLSELAERVGTISRSALTHGSTGSSLSTLAPGSIDRSVIESETVHLRHELATAGGVNMEALNELDELQARYDRLSGHYQDLSEAKTTLIKTMNKIDEDSRELFVTTLNAIRTNFQDLYRRSFGGGFADIVLEDENDPESGIEIVATPPGKTTLSNTLLSGGEKALTAVALIMAFFQYRPSPFCILDEVDAPFDEANIGRFVTVLREFLDTTKFIVVTHSKKTMTAANMIYGITMQESGVSRQVSVRFEEVDDRGAVIQEKRAA
jgi:chromosome segregation protein